MKNLIKKHSKILLLAGVLLFSFEVFSASEATKQLIHEVLAKYGISAGGKEVCGTPFEPQYNKTTGKVRCNSYDATTGMNANNYWSPKDRLCKECPVGTLLNKTTFQTCNQVNCPEGRSGVDVLNGNCPKGMGLFAPDLGKCPKGYTLVAPDQGICPKHSKPLKIVDGKCPEGYRLKQITHTLCPEGYKLFKQE